MLQEQPNPPLAIVALEDNEREATRLAIDAIAHAVRTTALGDCVLVRNRLEGTPSPKRSSTDKSLRR